jgi:heat shock protein HtpX
VCVTAGLRQLLNEQELAGVVAHELAHIQNRDVLISTIAAMIAGAISYLAYMAMWFGGGREDEESPNPLVGLLLMIFAPLAAMLIQMAISRSREYEADRLGAELAGSPRGLARALEKLERGASQVPLPVMDAQRNMFIVEPLTGMKVARLFMTHPSVEDRIRRLMDMSRGHVGTQT